MDLSNIPRELNTPDLHLRPSTLADAEGMFAMLSDPESMKYWCDQPVPDIEADVDSENTGSLGLLEKLGFKREGLFRERWFVYDEWQDSVMLALINEESL